MHGLCTENGEAIISTSSISHAYGVVIVIFIIIIV